MRTERTDILIKRTDSVLLSEACTQREEHRKPVHFHVMQSLKHNKWVLAAVKGTFEEYQVTDVMSSNVELLVQYAGYLNDGTISAGLEPRQIEMLNQLKIKYME